MIKIFALLPRRPDLSPAEFDEHWRHVHSGHVSKMVQLRRYAQSHWLDPQPAGFPPSPLVPGRASGFAGIAEAWFADLAVAGSITEDPDYTDGVKVDEPNFIDVERMRTLLTEEREILGGPSAAASGTKALILVRRDPGLDPTEFRRAWGGRHAELLASVPGLVRFVEAGVVPEAYELFPEPPVYDGVTELWWPDLPAALAGFASPEMRAALDDLAGFTAPACAAVLVEELRFIWP